MGEGEWWIYQYTPWHCLPLGILVPKRLANVFVTTAVSSTHVSFGTYRLEPVRMAFGQAAGIAANLCIRYHLDARDVPARQVQEDLLPHPDNPYGDPNISLYYLSDVPTAYRHYRAIQYLAARGFEYSAETLKPDAPTTRGEFARWLYDILPPVMGRTAPLATTDRYADLDGSVDRNVLEALYAWGIDSRLWDGGDALAPKGRLYFKPKATLSHGDLFAALYIAQIPLGPLFFDNPVDGRNGRAVPPAIFETAIK
jgi:hypothetical protein